MMFQCVQHKHNTVYIAGMFDRGKLGKFGESLMICHHPNINTLMAESIHLPNFLSVTFN